jgi:hypothetical protein
VDSILNQTGGSGNEIYKSTLHISVLDSISRTKYVFVSLAPMYISVLVGIGYPKLIGKFIFESNNLELFGIFGLLIYNYNGFIIPFLLKRRLNQIENKNFIRKFFNYFMLCFFIIAGVTGFGNDMYELITGKTS